MNIGILLPSIYASKRYGEGRIFAPGTLAVDLANNLVKRGHAVKLYTSGDVKTDAEVVAGDADLTDRDLSYFQFRYRDPLELKYTTFEIIKRDFEYDLTMRAYRDAKDGKLDVIHSYHDFGAHYFNEITGFPTVYTLHDPLPQTDDTIEYHRFSRFAHHNYISISNKQRDGIVKLNFIRTIYHGIHIEEYDFNPNPGEYLMYFGRVLEDKGTDIAIDVAHRLNEPFWLATSNIRGNRSAGFFDEKIAPEIDSGRVQNAGFLTGKPKSEFIGKAKAFLMPLRWDEPFGMVMIEAMACGVPVIAYAHGSAPEIVRDGVTGFIVDPGDGHGIPGDRVVKKTGIEGLMEAVTRLGEIDRAACRKHVEENFTVERMVEGHEEVYHQISGK
jgi:glycosyltransferase involved in cell wall biosynthesis